MLAENRRRFNPAVHQDSEEYIADAKGPFDHNFRVSLVLGGIFTPLCEQFHDNLMASKLESGLPIPRFLSGREPKIYMFDTDPKSKHEREIYVDSIFSTSIPVQPMLGECLSTGHFSNDTFDISIPIGLYGKDLAVATVQTVRALYALLPKTVGVEAFEVFKENKYTLLTETFQSDPIYSMMEGALTIGQAYAVLSADKNPHYQDDPVGLFRRLLQEKVFDQFAAYLPAGKLPTLAHRGATIEGAFDQDTFQLTGTLRGQLQHEREAVIRQRGIRSVRITHKGCPVAREHTPTPHEEGTPGVIDKSGITLMGEVFADYLEHYYTLPTVA